MSAITEQPTRAIPVTASGTTNIPVPGGVGAILYVGIGGDINCVTEGGDSVLFASVPSGTILPVKIKRVNILGTSADSILALF
jgi:hypothetical protein